MDMTQAVVNPNSHIGEQTPMPPRLEDRFERCGISKTYGKAVASSTSRGKRKWVVSGIFGYIGPRHPLEVLLRGLREVQHMGYDSCGIAIAGGGETKIVRTIGSVADLETKLRQCEPIVKGVSCGIGETLWMTRTRPT